MSNKITSWPLAWPTGWKRTPENDRKRGEFATWTATVVNGAKKRIGKRITMAEAIERLMTELERLGVTTREDVVVSTNIETRLNGMPYGGKPEPKDTGGAVYWRIGANTRSMAIDGYDRVADNIAALALTLAYMRGIERHGGAEILDRVFLGFQALPSPDSEPWWAVLGFKQGENVTKAQAEENYRRLAMQHHPDKGGDAGKFSEIARAIEAARLVL